MHRTLPELKLISFPTIRSRKVKCDESRPACLKCTTTGRICAGYGIFGGGSACPTKAFTSMIAVSSFTKLPNNVISGSALDANEQYHLEWFFCRTSTKLTGAFPSPESEALLFQACAAEEAVTHAVLALCAIHRNTCIWAHVQSQRPSPEESFILTQYNKSIKCLQHDFRDDSTPSLRTALFLASSLTVVESFRGCYRTARLHLEFGLRLLKQLSSKYSTTGPLGRSVSISYTDEHFFRTFKRLYVQYALLQKPHVSWGCDLYTRPISHLTTFASTDSARSYLEDILLDLRQLELSNVLSPSVFQCSTRGRPRKAVKKDLTLWKSVYNNTMLAYNATIERQKWFAYKLLHLYYTMAEIMADALQADDERIYDSMTCEFVSMLRQLLVVKDIASRAELRAKYFGPEEGLSHSIADLGGLCPLYFIAAKCRVPRIRLQAIELLGEMPRQEYIWDSTLAVAIARTIMQLEEGDAYENIVAGIGFCPNTMPEWSELEAPTIFPSERVRYVDVQLPDRPLAPVTLRCKRQGIIEDLVVVL